MNRKQPIFIKERSSNSESISFSHSAKKRRADQECGQSLGSVKRQRRATKGATTPLQQHRGTRKSPPGSGWQFKHVKDTHHWVSPTRNIEFIRYTQACEFEKLRSKYGSDEILAWKLYRKLKFCKHTRVVNAHRYDFPNSEKGVQNNDLCKQGRQVAENDSGNTERLMCNDRSSK